MNFIKRKLNEAIQRAAERKAIQQECRNHGIPFNGIEAISKSTGVSLKDALEFMKRKKAKGAK